MSKFTLIAKDLEDIAPTLSAALPHPLNILFDDVTDTLEGGDQEVYNAVVSEQAIISIEDLEGHTIGGQWRIIRALKPVKGAPHGGFILEHLERADTPEEE